MLLLWVGDEIIFMIQLLTGQGQFRDQSDFSLGQWPPGPAPESTSVDPWHWSIESAFTQNVVATTCFHNSGPLFSVIMTQSLIWVFWWGGIICVGWGVRLLVSIKYQHDHHHLFGHIWGQLINLFLFYPKFHVLFVCFLWTSALQTPPAGHMVRGWGMLFYIWMTKCDLWDKRRSCLLRGLKRVPAAMKLMSPLIPL